MMIYYENLSVAFSVFSYEIYVSALKFLADGKV